MNSRKSFLKKGIIMLASFSIPGCSGSFSQESYKPMKTRQPEKALVIWYSQSGHTKRYGRLIARIWEKIGLNVDACDIRDIDRSELANYDLVVIGTPVFYYDTPSNVRDWLKGIPNIDGTPVASYASFGGPEGNQHNAACSLLELMLDKGGVPVGLDTFKNMATWPSPSWDGPGLWENKHLPNEETYNSVRNFATRVVREVKHGNTIAVERRTAVREFLRILPLVWFTKCAIGTHAIDKDKCTECGTCVERCPSGAIDLSGFKVDTDRCIACYGCINNCPADAVVMEFMGKKIYGFPEFLRRNNITIKEPTELQKG